MHVRQNCSNQKLEDVSPHRMYLHPLLCSVRENCFELNLNVGIYRHLDDTTDTFTFKEVVAIYFHCVGFGCNAVYPWNPLSVLWTQTRHPPAPSAQRWGDHGWIFMFGVNYLFKWVGPPRRRPWPRPLPLLTPPSARPESSAPLNADVLLTPAGRPTRCSKLGSKLLLLLLLAFPLRTHLHR